MFFPLHEGEEDTTVPQTEPSSSDPWLLAQVQSGARGYPEDFSSELTGTPKTTLADASSCLETLSMQAMRFPPIQALHSLKQQRRVLVHASQQDFPDTVLLVSSKRIRLF